VRWPEHGSGVRVLTRPFALADTLDEIGADPVIGIRIERAVDQGGEARIAEREIKRQQDGEAFAATFDPGEDRLELVGETLAACPM
jgi:hypothetical protein